MKRKRSYAARLLSKKKDLTTFEKERILENLLAGAAPERARPKWALWGAFAGAALAAGLAGLLFLLPSTHQAEFTSRGRDEANVRVACHVEGGAPRDARCQVGEKIFFEAQTSRGHPYFSAFAHTQDGRLMWFFPRDADVQSENPTPDFKAKWLPEAAPLGSRDAGTMTVYALFSRQPLTQEAIRQLFKNEDFSGSADVQVIVRTLEVAP